jgi:hypothetical protein
MKLQSTALILAAVAWPGLGQSRVAAVEAVDVYVSGRDGSSLLLGSGRPLAAAIFKKIGVRINWHAGELQAGQRAFGIRTLEQAPESATSGALASARLVGSSGTEITVYKDRVQRFLDNHRNLAGVAAAYVLAHELAHAMQGVPRHSASGILKAQWSNDDYQEMIFQKLAFASVDVELIHRGLALQLANRRSELPAEALR